MESKLNVFLYAISFFQYGLSAGMFFLAASKEKNHKLRNLDFIFSKLPFSKLSSLNKTDLLYKENKFENTNGVMYHFAKLLTHKMLYVTWYNLYN